MNYELAKELKDAGFPQLLGDETVMRAMDSSGAYAKVGTRMPTFEELIEACKGDGLFELTTMKIDEKVYWYASLGDVETKSGSTPTEAVARLWLALNKKGIE